jgi:hypothetical protein
MGSGGSDPVGGAGAGSGGDCDGFMILATSCAGGNCHSGGGLSLFASDLETAEEFIDEPSGICGAGAGVMFDPANPSASLVIQKVRGTSSCGGRMPIGGTLSEEEITCIEDWIGTL